jgi:hypothetical protein
MYLQDSQLGPLPPRPADVFPVWLPAQRVARRHARATLPPTAALRALGCLPQARAERIAEWYTGAPTADAREVAGAYEALDREVAVLARTVAAELGVRVTLVTTPDDPYEDGAALCADLRRRRAMRLRAAAVDAPHPVLSDATLDRLRTVHDVLGHAALGLGFDLQSEYAAWLYCRPLFSPAARPAAFCELVGAVTAFVVTGTKPVLRADLPPAIMDSWRHTSKSPVGSRSTSSTRSSPA